VQASLATNLAIEDNLLEEVRSVGKHEAKRRWLTKHSRITRNPENKPKSCLLHSSDCDPDYGYMIQRKMQ
jgi:hypothetical protein